jgi:hypothetical protein
MEKTPFHHKNWEQNEVMALIKCKPNECGAKVVNRSKSAHGTNYNTMEQNCK